MDAVEFIRERNRMCRAFDKSCDGCPAYENGWECDNDAWDEKIVATVEQWSKEHPCKTRQSGFLEQWPEAKRVDNILAVCPKVLNMSFSCWIYNNDNVTCEDCRREFWMQEVE